MIYVIYEEYKNKYYETQKEYDIILNEKEKLFMITQPSAVKFDKEIVSGGTTDNTFDRYLILKEEKKIDQRLNEIKSILDDRERLLKLKEQELRASTSVQDKIYKYRYLDRLKVFKIAKLVGYSEPQIYRILKAIKREIGGNKWLNFL